MNQKNNRLRSLYHEHKEVLVAIFIALFLSAVSIKIFTNQSSSIPNKTNNSISIESQVSTPTSQTIAQKGDQLSWKKSLSMTNAVTNLDGSVIEEIDEKQEFDGSVKLPKGWVIQYSCSSRDVPAGDRIFNDSPACPTNEVTFLKISTGSAQSLKPYSNTSLTQPPQELNLNNGNNKTLPPVLYGNKLFQIMSAVTVEDAGSSGDFTINCFDLTTYSECSGQFPTYFSTQIGSLGEGPKDINTPANMQSYLDDGSNGAINDKGKLYFPGQHGNSYGVVCLNLAELANCGFTVLGTTGTSYGSIYNPVLLSGFVKSGTRLYGHANDQDKTYQTVICFELNSDGQGTDSTCSDFSANTVASTPTYLIAEHYNTYFTTGNHIIENNKLYWIVDYSTNNIYATALFPPPLSQRSVGTSITCFDLITKSHCTGWPNNYGGINVLGTGGLYTSLARPTSLFAWKNTDNSMKAVCLIIGLQSGSDPFMNCFDAGNGSYYSDINGTPGHPGKMFPSGWIFFYWTGSPYVLNTTDDQGSKTYIPMYNTSSNQPNANPAKGATFCWNWTTASKCADFASPKYWHGINNGNSGDLGYFYDGSCMWGVGYGNKIWSFNAKTGETPCRALSVKYTAALDANDFYCDGQSHVFKWGKVKLASASMYDFQSLNVVVKDSSGNVVLSQGNLKSNDTLDLSGISYQSNQQLNIEIKAEVYSTSPWAGGNDPLVNVVADADSSQYCYKTTAKQYCDISDVQTQTKANIVTDIDTLVSDKTTGISINQPQNEQCFKDVKISINPNKTNLTIGDEVTYKITVVSKANINIYNRGNIVGSKIVANLPAGFEFISSSNNGSYVDGKVEWDNQAVNAGDTIEREFTIKANKAVSLLDKNNFGKVYAATSQSNVTVTASVESNDDIYQEDNNAQNNSLVLTSITNDEQSGTSNPDPTEPSGNTENPETTVNTDHPTTQTNEQNTNNIEPVPISGYKKSIFAKMGDSISGVVNSATQNVPPVVVNAIPYGVITFLMAFALIYLYQAYKVTRYKLKVRFLKKKYEASLNLKQDFLNLATHYLVTPIATLKSSIGLYESNKSITKSVVDTSMKRIEQLNSHTQELLKEMNGGELTSTNNSVKNQRNDFLNIGMIVPILGIMTITIVSNILLTSTDKFNFTSNTLIVQSVYFLLGLIAFVSAFLIYKSQKTAQIYEDSEMKTHRQMLDMQNKLINESYRDLSDDIMELELLLPSLKNVPKVNLFENGIQEIKYVNEKLKFLGSLTSKNIIPTKSSETIKETSIKILNELQDYADQKSVNISTDIEPGLTLSIDKSSFQFLLYSILNNAIKFNNVGGKVKLKINKQEKNQIAISVWDNGKGIDAKVLKRLFKPFSRESDSIKFNTSGMGLDLYMDKLIVEQNGGSINIESKNNSGTEIKATLLA